MLRNQAEKAKLFGHICNSLTLHGVKNKKKNKNEKRKKKLVSLEKYTCAYHGPVVGFATRKTF